MSYKYKAIVSYVHFFNAEEINKVENKTDLGQLQQRAVGVNRSEGNRRHLADLSC